MIWVKKLLGLLAALVLATACAMADEPTPIDTELGTDLFLQIIKSDAGTMGEGVLNAYLRASDGDYVLHDSWDICTWSGTLGPKLREGDGQSPEGFYYVTPSALNPNSSYHLSFNLGFPNAFDRAQGRTGSFLMVHGACVSIGCYAMTDDGIEEIYALVERAFTGGQAGVRTHIFPFPMTETNMAEHAGNPNITFWRNLKTGWDRFEADARPPDVTVADKTYVFGAPQ
jgi:murein L,D-transpeptidase YafK